MGLGSDTLPDVGRGASLSRGQRAGVVQADCWGKGEVQGRGGGLCAGQAFHRQDVDPFSIGKAVGGPTAQRCLDGSGW